MKYNITLPITALFAVLLIQALIYLQVIPSGMEMLERLQNAFDQRFFLLVFVIILLEAIVYVGFYFPGQFFAVLLVVISKPSWQDILWLTLAMVLAATLGSLINYFIGRRVQSKQQNNTKPSFKRLLLAMIHINSLAFFMLNQGANKRSISVVLWAGLLNLPYYLALIALTATLSKEVMALAENPWVLVAILITWLAVAGYFDWRKYHGNTHQTVKAASSD